MPQSRDREPDAVAHGPDGHALRLGSGGTVVRVTDAAGTPLGPSRPVPEVLAKQWAGFPDAFTVIAGEAAFVPGTDGVVLSVEREGPAGGWWDGVRGWLGLATRPTTGVEHYWLDMAGDGPAIPFRTVDANGYTGLAAGPGCVDLVVNGPGGATYEEWAVPPRREPWPWAVTAGAVAGLLAG